MQSSDDAIYSVTPDGLIESWNPAAERLYGYRAEEIVGKHVALTVPPERRDEIDQNIRRVMAGEHLQDQETVRLAKDGGTVDVSLTISPDPRPRRQGDRDVDQRPRHHRPEAGRGTRAGAGASPGGSDETPCSS